MRSWLLVLGIVWAIGAEVIRLAGGWSPGWIVVDAVPGLAFLICGVVAWERRPEGRIGPLMIATGYTWYAGTFAAAAPPVGGIAHGFQGWYDAFLAWLVLAYPTGYLRSRAARVTIATFLAILAMRSVVRLATIHVSTDYDLANPGDIERFVADETFRTNVEALFTFLVAAIAVVVVILVFDRLRSATALGRRVAGPILLGGLAFALGIVVETVSLLSANTFAERSAAWDVGQWLTSVPALLVAVAFVLGLARSRIGRGSVADLVVELGQPTPAQDLERLLRGTLRDPSLAIVHAAEGSDGTAFVDAAGRPVELPPSDDPRRAVTRLDVGGRTIAALIHDAALVEQPELVRSVAAAAALALENERLAADVRAQLDEVRRSRARIVSAGDAERRRIERDIHDGAQQQLVTVALLLQVARTKAEDADPELSEMIARAATQLESALGELRRLARGLHPAVLVEEGLGPAVEALVDRIPVPVETHVGPERLDPEIEATAYFVVAEALTNVVRHAQANAVKVEIKRLGDVLRVEIVDDGVGGADPASGSGLTGLADRVAAAGGTLLVTSPRGRGTTIAAELPCG